MARFTGGWIKLWRKAVEGDLADNPYLWALWNWLLFAAIWKPTSIIWEGKRRDLEPGTVILGMTELAERWQCSRNTIKKWLDYLVTSERIYLESCTRGTLVTIRNWSVYQSNDSESCTPSDSEVATGCPQGDNQVALSEEVKKERKKEVIQKPNELFDTLSETFRHFGIQKDPKFDEVNLTRLIQANGMEKCRLAIVGARFEDKTDTFDPAKHFSIRRLMKADVFEKLVNLGSRTNGVWGSQNDRMDEARAYAAKMDAYRKSIIAGEDPVA